MKTKVALTTSESSFPTEHFLIETNPSPVFHILEKLERDRIDGGLGFARSGASGDEPVADEIFHCPSESANPEHDFSGIASRANKLHAAKTAQRPMTTNESGFTAFAIRRCVREQNGRDGENSVPPRESRREVHAPFGGTAESDRSSRYRPAVKLVPPVSVGFLHPKYRVASVARRRARPDPTGIQLPFGGGVRIASEDAIRCRRTSGPQVRSAMQ